jgi:hypothetical protein
LRGRDSTEGCGQSENNLFFESACRSPPLEVRVEVRFTAYGLTSLMVKTEELRKQHEKDRRGINCSSPDLIEQPERASFNMT